MKHKQKIVTIGGGTGSFVVLSGLKNFDVDLTAIVCMADDGGSTGILRDELGVLPPGDIRQCLVALSKSSETLRELFNYRYSRSSLHGHNFGNIFLSTLEKVTGNFNQAIKEAGKILRIKGRVLPVTLKNTKLVVELKNKKVVGEHNLENIDFTKLKKIYLKPNATGNPEAIKAIKEADKIILNPGNLYRSIIPNLLVKGIKSAIIKSKAKKIYICNLMNKIGQTDNYSICDYINTLEKYLKNDLISYIIYNTGRIDEKLLKKYSREGEQVITSCDFKKYRKRKFIGRDLISRKKYKQKAGDPINRTLIRHDSNKLAKILINI